MSEDAHTRRSRLQNRWSLREQHERDRSDQREPDDSEPESDAPVASDSPREESEGGSRN